MGLKIAKNLAAYAHLLERHRGEAAGSYDDVAIAYDGFATIWDQHIAAPALHHFNRIIGERVKPGAYILDAAAGTGERTLALLHNSAPRAIVALDASQGMLTIARTKIHDPRVQFMQGDIHALPFADNTFDVVACTWAIEITDDPRAVVQEFIRVIKPDGFVIYAFCSLPSGKKGERIQHMLRAVADKSSPVSHLLNAHERPFHQCEQASLTQFAGGLTSVATVAKCCQVLDAYLPSSQT